MERAVQIIDQIQTDQKILLIEAGKEPRLRSGFIDDKKKVRDLLLGFSPSDESGNLEKALYFALSFMDPARDDTVYLVTDGAGCDFSKLINIHPKIVPEVILGGENNIGITKFEYREELDSPGHYEIMLEIKNFNVVPVTCPVRLTIDRTIIFETSISLDILEKRLLIIPYRGLVTGIASAVLEIEDDFHVDNSAYLALSGSKDIWVLLVSKGNYFLEKILEAYPNVMVNSMSEIMPSSWEEQTIRHDIVIIDRMDFPAIGRGNFLLIDSFSPSIPIKSEGRVVFPGTFFWEKENPLMENIDMDGVIIEQASKLRADKGAKAIVESPQTGLMYTYEDKGIRAVFLGFDINRSDLPLKIAFPVMISNIINWLNPNKLISSTLKTRPGEPIDIYLSPETTTISTLAPDERWERHDVTTNPFQYRDTDKVGIYTISENKKRRYFTVNLADEMESDIQSPVIESTFIRQGEVSDGEEVPIRRPLWVFVILLVLSILLLEWYFWLKVG